MKHNEVLMEHNDMQNSLTQALTQYTEAGRLLFLGLALMKTTVLESMCTLSYFRLDTLSYVVNAHKL